MHTFHKLPYPDIKNCKKNKSIKIQIIVRNMAILNWLMKLQSWEKGWHCNGQQWHVALDDKATFAKWREEK